MTDVRVRGDRHREKEKREKDSEGEGEGETREGIARAQRVTCDGERERATQAVTAERLLH